jgi:hypothetical protein
MFIETCLFSQQLVEKREGKIPMGSETVICLALRRLQSVTLGLITVFELCLDALKSGR